MGIHVSRVVAWTRWSVPCIFLLHKWLRFIATNYTTHALHARFSVVVINRRRHCYDCNTLHYRDTQAWMLFLSSALLDMDSQVICTLDNFKAMPTNVVYAGLHHGIHIIDGTLERVQNVLIPLPSAASGNTSPLATLLEESIPKIR